MNRKAMALVETIVSMLILAVAALAVASTMLLVNSSHRRAAGGSSLDLQAASYARDTLDQLKNSVSTNAATNAPLVAGVHDTTADLPATFRTAAINGSRAYRVTDVVDPVSHSVAMKQVTVCVAWAPDDCTQI